MTHAVNKLAAWLATMVVAGLLLLVSSAAQAHVPHGGESFVSVTALEVVAVRGAVADRSVPAVELGAQEYYIGISDSGSQTDHLLPSAETSCCGNGVSACSAGGLAQAPSVLPRPLSCAAEGPFGTAALMGVIVDGLIRPPRATV